MKRLRQALQESRPCITAELSAGHFSGTDDFLGTAEQLATTVDAVQIASDDSAKGQVSPLALCALLLQRDIDPVPHLDNRDRNRIALQSDLLGLRALGVSSLVTSDGIIPEAGLGGAKPVFDVAAGELIATIDSMNEEPWADAGHELIVGRQLTAEQVIQDLDTGTLQQASGPGARFLQIRPTADVALLKRCMQGLIDARLTWRHSVIVSLDAGPCADNCVQSMREAAGLPGVSGINLLCRNDPGTAVAAIRDFLSGEPACSI